MHKKLPAPATVLAMLALLVSLTGTAVAAGAVPLAKKAIFANNAGKLQGKTAAQLVATPGPASTVSDLVTTSTAPFTLAGGDGGDFAATCPDGSKVLSGGYTYDGSAIVLSADTRPKTDTTWSIFLVNISESTASGTITAICLR